MRSMWKGVISFGLVTIPIKLYTATENKDLKFNYLHNECKTPIKYEKTCPTCNRSIGQEEIVRGYEYERGKYVIIKDEDLQSLPLESVKAIQILDFVDMKEIDPIYYTKAYYLAPGDFGSKAYRLLYNALKESGRVAIAKIFLRTKENLASLRIYGNCLLMETMLYPEEIRSPEHIPELEGLEEIKIHQNELKMAKNLIDNLTAGFDPKKYTSDYREALRALIEAKINDEEIAIPERPETAKVVNLMEALKASVQASEKKKKTGTPSNRKKRKVTI